MSSSNLYPPIIDTFMPPFEIKKETQEGGIVVDNTIGRVYFSLSSYNTLSEIKHAQVTVVYQNTNKNALISTFKNAIKCCTIHEDTTKQTDDKYYIELLGTDILRGLETNTYYKVQIRFSEVEPSTFNPPASWYNENLDHFSEWSSVCIIKGISTPTITITGNNNGTISITNPILTVVGNFSCADGDQEHLDNYTLTLADMSSGAQYTNKFSNPNEINYTFKQRLTPNTTYTLKLTYTTGNGFIPEEELTYTVSVAEEGTGNKLSSIETVLNEAVARVELRVKESDEVKFKYPIVIQRSDSDSEFTIWEDIYTFTNSELSEFIWYDYTVEGGKIYQYSAQYVNGTTRYEAIDSNLVLVTMDDIYINGDGLQLKIMYDQSINSYTNRVAINKNETIGSQYAYVRQNGNMNYKEFTVAGLISYWSDVDNYLFMSDEELYGKAGSNIRSIYNAYALNNINKDYIAEKKFRDKVISYLNNAQVKLFRSMTEGNILVKPTSVTLNPNQSLGRLVWTANINFTEVGKADIDAYGKYKIQAAEGSASEETFFQAVAAVSDSFLIHTADEPDLNVREEEEENDET